MQTKQNAADPQILGKNPLLEFAPSPYKSFDEWLARWQAMTGYEEKLGLLYALGTNERIWEESKAVPFLLRIAYGYLNRINFMIKGENIRECPPGTDPAALRQRIAEKAVSVLCSKFFCLSYQQRLLTDGRLFREVIRFFVTVDGYGLGLKNYPHSKCNEPARDRERAIMLEFLRRLTRYGWDRQQMWESRGCCGLLAKKICRRLMAARPMLIEIMNELGDLSELLDEELDEASLAKLEEIALRRELSLPSSKQSDSPTRKPKTLEEAVLGGSSAARVLILSKIQIAERSRIQDLYRIDEQQQSLEAEKAKLLQGANA